MHEDYPETLYSLAWHNASFSPGGSDLPIPEYSTRGAMYGVGGIPHTQWMGTTETVGGYPSGNWTPMYNTFVPIYNSFIVDPLAYDVLLYGSTEGTTVSYHVDVTRNQYAGAGSVTAYVFAWQDSIEGYWSGASQNGISRFVVRDQLASQTFTLNNEGDSGSLEGSFTILDNWDEEQLGITVVVQQVSDHLVVGLAKATLDGLVIDEDSDGVFNFEDNCPNDYNPNQEDVDGDDIGDACDPCDNANVYVAGNVNGDVLDNLPIIDLFDVIMLVDLILDDDYPGCTGESANFNGDNYVNVLDVVMLAQYVAGLSGREVPTHEDSEVHVLSLNDGASKNLVFSSELPMSGIEFTVPYSEGVERSLDNTILPEGWIVTYAEKEGTIHALIVDISGTSGLKTLALELSEFDGFESLMVSSQFGKEIPVVYDRKESPDLIGIPTSVKLNDLYPNPFNPVVSIPFSIPYQTDVHVAVYNLNGQLVDVLLNAKDMVSGIHQVTWNATEHASGVYLVQIQTPQGIDTKKAYLLK